MNRIGIATLVAAVAMVLTAPAFGQGEKDGQGRVIVTVLPKHEGDATPGVLAQDATLKVNGKNTKITSLEALKGERDPIELVLLIDGSARTSLGRQMDEMARFVKSLPPNIRATFGYMENGAAKLAGPLTADHDAVLRGLHLPGGTAGSNASPYFCLSDLAKRWPSEDRNARREVLMIGDGVDNYERRFDPDDPYVQAAIADSVRAGLVVYAIYWRDQGFADQTRYAGYTGQNLLQLVAEATGGKSFWQGTGNPVSFQPYLEELTRRFQNQYELSFAAPFNGKPQVEQFKLRFKAPGAEVDSPEQVFVARPGVAVN
jgi:hypothetical protein